MNILIKEKGDLPSALDLLETKMKEELIIPGQVVLSTANIYQTAPV